MRGCIDTLNYGQLYRPKIVWQLSSDEVRSAGFPHNQTGGKRDSLLESVRVIEAANKQACSFLSKLISRLCNGCDRGA
jgi:hypothetical protein